MKYCTKCGNPSPPDAMFCEQCGNKSHKKLPTDSKQIRKRHDFITFWLWAMIVSGLIFIVLEIDKPESDGWVLFNAFFGIGAAIWLLRWHKFGFWNIIGIYCITILFNPSLFEDTIGRAYSFNYSILALVGYLLAPILLYAILQIKREGISCWENLE